MIEMILKMVLITCFMCVLNVVIQTVERNKIIHRYNQIYIGIVFGLAAIISTHFGINYETMVLNVRDIAPLSAGLFFGPVSGILSGLIGGAERYIAGRFFSVGSYTTVACSVATALAGFLGALFNRYIFKGKKPSPVYALFLGGVTEVFHMFCVFLTHSDDINNAFTVVDTCAIPMIFFTSIGLCLSSILLSLLAGERKSLHKPKEYEVPITTKFQLWLFVFVVIMTFSTFTFSYSIQTRQTMQTVHSQMEIKSEDIRNNLSYMDNNLENAVELTKTQALNFGHAIAREIENTGGISNLTNERLYELQELYDIYELNAINQDGYITATTNPDFMGFDMSQGEQSAAFLSLLDGTETELVQDYMPTTADSNVSVMYTGVKVSDGVIQVGFDDNNIKVFSDLANYTDTLSNQHIGENGSVLVADLDGVVLTGEMKDENLKALGCYEEDGTYFNTTLFDTRYLCLSTVTDDYRIIVLMPYNEIYRSRNISAYETAFADILIFALVFILIYILVQKIVVENLNRINTSLNKITRGNLDEVVDVHSSAEFTSLSTDINTTVAALKRYIQEAENRIAKELEFANSIQTSALPHNFDFPSRDEFKLYASMNPAKEVGGDFYDFFFVDHNKLALVIADVSGKGIPAALFMMRSKATIKSLAEMGNSPAEVFTKANSLLCEGNDVEMFVTAWIGIIDFTTGIMTCANAGHEYPAIRQGGNTEYELLKDKHGFVLGGMDGVRYKEYQIKLTEGARIFVYTDGVAEAVNTANEQFGTENMIHALNENPDVSVEETLKKTETAIFRFCDDAEQFDDITMMCFEFDKKASS